MFMRGSNHGSISLDFLEIGGTVFSWSVIIN